MPSSLNNGLSLKLCNGSVIFLLVLTSSVIAQTDTMRHIDPSETLVKYRYNDVVLGVPEWGYFSGHNIYADLEWAEKYEATDSVRVIGVIAHHYSTSTSTSKQVTYNVYRAVGTQGLPLIKFTGEPVTHDKVKKDGSETYVAFATPVETKGSFFVSFEVPDYLHNPSVLGNDTMVLLSSPDGSRDAGDLPVYGRNMVRFHQQSENPGWNDVYTDMDQKYQLHFAIYPVIEHMGTGIADLIGGDAEIKWIGGPSGPVAKKLHCRLELKKAWPVSLHLLDIRGRECFRQGGEVRSAGTQNLETDLSAVGNGSYILVIQAGPHRLARKIVVEH